MDLRTPHQPTFSVEHRDGITVLRLNPQAVLAGRDLNLVSDLWSFFDEERKHPSPVLAVITAPGFLGRLSLSELLGISEAGETGVLPMESRDAAAFLVREENVINRFVDAVRSLDSFVVGVVQGEVVLPLLAPLLACDYRVAAEDAVFLNFAGRTALAPLGTLPWFLVHLVGAAKAAEILLESEKILAPEARELGLVNHIASPVDIEDETFALIDRLTNIPRTSLIGIKRAMVATCWDLRTYRDKEAAWLRELGPATTSIPKET